MTFFENISNWSFQNGELEARPGDSFTADDPGRATMVRRSYKWHLSEAEGDNAPVVGDPEVDTTETGIQEPNEARHVQLDEDGAHAEGVSSDGRDSKAKSKK